MKTNPHKEWIKFLRSERDKILSKTNIRPSQLIEKYGDMTTLESQYSFATDEHIKVKARDRGRIIDIQNVLASMIPAQEIYCHTGPWDNIMTQMRGFNISENMGKFFLPYPEMAITFEKRDGDKYSENFYTVFEMTEKYIYQGNKYPIYTVKSAWFDEKDMDLPAKRTFDFSFVVPLLPRIYIDCPRMKDCGALIAKDPFENTDVQFKKPGMLCLRTPNTACACQFGAAEFSTFPMEVESEFWRERMPPGLREMIVKGAVRIGDQAIQALIAIMIIMQRFQARSTKKVEKDIAQPRQPREKKVVDQKPKQVQIGERVIYLTEKSYRYSEPAAKIERSDAEKRHSPCEHYRREHTRRLRNGDIITIPGKVVSKGNKKKIKYILN